nr:hypothetical protein [Elizabethkingia bruuniana]
MITDTSYSNLIFRKDNEWYTPETFYLMVLCVSIY